ncbi:MAG: TetR/AcrR family transcriptional regulator [Gemmatimonadaceae bacterium]|nr:TetR/AcrR family transcriptional regulator [Gemmatimonadaceae bacterium]
MSKPATEPTDEAAPVRAPQQDRGHRRVEQILDAAESVFAEVGVDAATTNAIAERAGASMGSLYHFFRDRDAIVLAVARRFAERIRDRNATAMSPDALHAELPELFDRIISTHARFIEETPAFGIVEAVMHRKFGECTVKSQLDEAIIDQVKRFLELRLPRMGAEQRLAATRLSVIAVGEACERVQDLSPAERDSMLRELRDMLVRYFEPLDRAYGTRGG